MPLTLLDLSLLIDLVEDKLDEIHAVLNDETVDERITNEAGDLSIIYGNTAGRLQQLYESQWRPDCNYPSYEDLISRKIQ